MFTRLCQTLSMLIFISTALLSTSHAAKIYHWVDEDGRSHYSEKPSREIQSKTLNVRPTGIGSASSAHNKSDSTTTKKEIEAENATKEEVLTMEYSPEEKAQYCQQSRALLQQMNENSQRRVEQPDGSSRRLEQTEIADYKAQAQVGIESYCN